MTLLSYFMSFVSQDNQVIFISLFTSYISGFTMFFTNNLLVIMCAKLYDGNLESFATNRQIINISFIVYNILVNVMNNGSMKDEMFY